MPNKPFNVGDIVRLTILDNDAEVGQWFETTVTGLSSNHCVMLNLTGFPIYFMTSRGEGHGDGRTIEQGSRFEVAIQKFCFHHGSDGADIHQSGDYDRQWDEFKASLELV